MGNTGVCILEWQRVRAMLATEAGSTLTNWMNSWLSRYLQQNDKLFERG